MINAEGLIISVPAMPLPPEDGDLADFRDVDVIALDVDGTLLAASATELAARVLELHRILRAHPAPVELVLVTGRPWTGVRAVAGILGDGPHVVHFGSVVTDPAGGRALHRHAIGAGTVRQVADVFAAHGLAPSVVECGEDLVETHWSVGGSDPQRLYDFGVPTRVVDALPPGLDAQVVLAGTTAELAAPVLAELARLDLDVIADFHAPSGILFADSPGASKAAGLTRALQYLGIDPGRTLAIGDAAPDAAMFSAVRVGVAVGTAEPEAIAAADYVCAGGASDAVVEVLELVCAARAPVR
jgi:hypothetical protein